MNKITSINILQNIQRFKSAQSTKHLSNRKTLNSSRAPSGSRIVQTTQFLQTLLSTFKNPGNTKFERVNALVHCLNFFESDEFTSEQRSDALSYFVREIAPSIKKLNLEEEKDNEFYEHLISTLTNLSSKKLNIQNLVKELQNKPIFINSGNSVRLGHVKYINTKN